METHSVRDGIASIVTKFAEHGASSGELVDSTDLSDDLGITSARLVDVVLELEECFHVELGDELFDSCRTFGGLVSAVQEHMASNA